MPDEPKPAAIPAPAAPPAAKSPRLTGWRLGLVIAGIVALALRVLLALFSIGVHHHASGPAPMPTWPLKAGDVFTLKPGDPTIAKWAESPDSDGFIVQAIEQNGKRLVSSKVCALEPDYMADPAQPGGTLTLVAQDGAGDWSVRWHGGDTLPPSDAPQPEDPTPHTNANCGKDALFMMSQAQLHSWLDMQTGVAAAQPQ